MPNAAMLGPLLVSAVVHLTGLAATSPPAIFVFASQIVIGSALGSGFIGAKWTVLRQAFLHGLVLVPLLCGVCLLVALAFAPLSGIPWNVVFLALAPGGTAEMSLVALALHAEIALVTSNQLVRILLINFGATGIFKMMRRANV